jgi:hypothetical protein
MALTADMSPGVLLQRMYARTSGALAGSPRERSIKTQELVDSTLNDVDRLIRGGTPEALDLLLSEMDVARVHPEALDMVLALLEDMVLPSLQGFRDRVDGRLAKVDEVLKPIRLQRCDGSVVSHDVRKDARALYRERAKAFGDALRKDGNLDKFYRTKAMRERARGDLEVEMGPDGAVTGQRR